MTGGKGYSKGLLSINVASGILADRRLTSIRQQSYQILSMDIKNVKIAASPATVYRRKNDCRMKALESCEANLDATNAMQLCYDGKWINDIDRYVFLSQIL